MPDALPNVLPDTHRVGLATRLAQAEQAASQKRLNEALGICRDLVEDHPVFAPAYAMMGAIEAHRGSIDEAAAHLERALKIDPTPAHWHGNISGIYRLQYRLGEALAAAREAVRLEPTRARNYVNLGKVLVDIGERDEAVECFICALLRDTEDAEAHLGLGQILLSEGNFRAGWVEYAWRNQLDQAKGTIPRMTTPIWNGMSFPSERLFLIADQGFGDSIQFARYIPMVAERCQEVILGCSPELAPLLGTIGGVGNVHSRWDQIPYHVSHSLLSSLPGILGTEIDTIPCSIPYLKADPALRLEWDERLVVNRQNEAPIVGIVWAGRPTHPNDGRRSLRLGALSALTDLPAVQLVSLQKPLPLRDSEKFASLGLVDWSHLLTDFSQTLALLSALDLVITVDSAVAHLAGAAGVPVWVMLPTPADWRWMDHRQDSPWYPTMRLFRQQKPGSWDQVINDVVIALRSWSEACVVARSCTQATI